MPSSASNDVSFKISFALSKISFKRLYLPSLVSGQISRKNISYFAKKKKKKIITESSFHRQ